MNRPHRVIGLGLACILGLFYCAVVKGAGPAGGAGTVQTIPQDAYTNPSGSRALIEAVVKNNVDVLVNDADPVAQGRARDAMVNATMTAGQPASPEFLYEYARALNNDCLPRVDPAKKASMRQRLNIAIVASRVAAVAKNTAMVDLVLKLINDPTEPVVLWGVKASVPIVPETVKVKVGNAVPPLVLAIRPAVLKHPSGAIVEEGYNALAGTEDAAVADELLKLWENRQLQYKGTDLPEDPGIDGKPVNALSTQSIWKTVIKDEESQTLVMQMISDQAALSAQKADAAPAGDKKDQLARVVQQCGAAAFVIGTHQNKPPLSAASVEVSKVGQQGSPGKLTPLVGPMIAAIQQAYPKVKPLVSNGTANGQQ